MALAGELLLLLLAAPALYFPNWLPTWASWVALALLDAALACTKETPGFS